RRVIRGPSCEDDRFVFQLARNGLSFYEFSNVPTPGEKEGVTPIEWLSDLKDIEQILAVEIDSLLRKVTHPHQVLLE
ncbi:hypothetical protein N9L22_06075, partial [Candidatus Poseidonia alphae]|nr:hypothetical protein [Candidatus Poseidonia alphae]